MIPEFLVDIESFSIIQTTKKLHDKCDHVEWKECKKVKVEIEEKKSEWAEKKWDSLDC
jgi:hypothetical protein